MRAEIELCIVITRLEHSDHAKDMDHVEDKEALKIDDTSSLMACQQAHKDNQVGHQIN